MSTGKSLHRQFTILVRELNDKGLQPAEIEQDEEVQRLGLALFGGNAFRRILREEIRRALQTDIDEITGARKRVAVPQPKLPMPEVEVDSTVPSRQSFIYESKAKLDQDNEATLLVIEELNKQIFGLITKRDVYIEEEERVIRGGFKKAEKMARLRLAS